jgi:hypothetical protein
MNINNIISLFVNEEITNELFYLYEYIGDKLGNLSEDIYKYVIENHKEIPTEEQLLTPNKYSEIPFLNSRHKTVYSYPYFIQFYKGDFSYVGKEDNKLSIADVKLCAIAEAKEYINQYKNILQAYYELQYVCDLFRKRLNNYLFDTSSG